MTPRPVGVGGGYVDSTRIRKSDLLILVERAATVSRVFCARTKDGTWIASVALWLRGKRVGFCTRRGLNWTANHTSTNTHRHALLQYSLPHEGRVCRTPGTPSKPMSWRIRVAAGRGEALRGAPGCGAVGADGELPRTPGPTTKVIWRRSGGFG